MLFIRLSVIAEVIAHTLRVNTYLLYLVGPPAILGALFSGGVYRTLRHRAALWWMGFFCWMVLATPFSTWVGISAHRILDYGRTNLVLLLIIGGLAVSWGEIRKVFYTVAAAGIVNLLTARIFLNQENGRYNLQASGTIGNSNDLASHFILILPFFLYGVLDRKRSWVVRIGLLGAIGYGLWVILGTASPRRLDRRRRSVRLPVITALFV